MIAACLFFLTFYKHMTPSRSICSVFFIVSQVYCCLECWKIDAELVYDETEYYAVSVFVCGVRGPDEANDSHSYT